MTDYGVLGVGAIAEAIVTGACAADHPPTVLLSPRNAARATALSERFASVGVAVLEISDARAFEAVSTSTAPAGADDFASLSGDYATPGGINEQFLTALREAGSFEVVRRSLDDVFARLAGPLP
jgi:pyrroline-5-carboxylate reductase